MNYEYKVQISEAPNLSLTIGGDAVDLSVEMGTPIRPPAYDGPYEVTPSGETQTLVTANRLATDNIVINPIPSNWGLITWNGSFLTVS